MGRQYEGGPRQSKPTIWSPRRAPLNGFGKGKGGIREAIWKYKQRRCGDSRGIHASDYEISPP